MAHCLSFVSAKVLNKYLGTVNLLQWLGERRVRKYVEPCRLPLDKTCRLQTTEAYEYNKLTVLSESSLAMKTPLLSALCSPLRAAPGFSVVEKSSLLCLISIVLMAQTWTNLFKGFKVNLEIQLILVWRICCFHLHKVLEVCTSNIHRQTNRKGLEDLLLQFSHSVLEVFTCNNHPQTNSKGQAVSADEVKGNKKSLIVCAIANNVEGLWRHSLYCIEHRGIETCTYQVSSD